MLLRAALLSVLFMSSSVFAVERPAFATKTFKLKSLTKIFHGQRTESQSKSDRAQLCGERLSPRMNERSGSPILELNAKLGFEWRDINEAPAQEEDCRYTVEQRVDAHSLVLVNGEECPAGKASVGSLREVLQLNNNEIVYQSEAVLRDGRQWRTDDSKESFVCVWVSI